ncbi:hypothetical protein QJS10_CPB17g01744 [Acorus calamus]|uniref:Uncharacterized protein n=1 Tax=Acorus calamus TaxID=4465 RepID=A0AAV9CWV3_ACOCL|nr:hypothetical protein QJS10_CPB17g01744 [Acorus calamus]
MTVSDLHVRSFRTIPLMLNPIHLAKTDSVWPAAIPSHSFDPPQRFILDLSISCNMKRQILSMCPLIFQKALVESLRQNGGAHLIKLTFLINFVNFCEDFHFGADQDT